MKHISGYGCILDYIYNEVRYNLFLRNTNTSLINKIQFDELPVLQVKRHVLHLIWRTVHLKI